MPSILSRLRTRAVSQTSAQSVPPAPASTTVTTVTTPTHDEQEERRLPVQGSAPATRRIYRDLDLLTNELAAEPSSISRGLSPPIRRGPHSSSNPPTPILGSIEPGELHAAPTADSPKASQSGSSSSKSAATGQRGFMERFGDWSTFGRRRAPPPSLNEFGTAQIPPSSPSAWRVRRANSRLSSRPSSSNRTTASTHSSPQENNNNNNTPRPSYQSSTERRGGHKRVSTFGAREVAPDSSPPENVNPGPDVGMHVVVPPMPPLDHPALRLRGTTATYPPDGRREIIGRFTFGKSVRAYRSLPRVQHIFKTAEDSKSRAGDDDGDNKGQARRFPVPTVDRAKPSSPGLVSIPIIATSSSSSPPSSPSSSSKSAPAVGPRPLHDPVPVASNLYDPHISIIGNVVPMQQDVPRVHDRKPLRSSLKATARPPIASSSSSNSVHMPSLSLVANVATDSAVPHTPVSSPGRSETAKGKRKAEDVDTTPPDSKKATFAVPGVYHVFSCITSGSSLPL
jgi:hypothetical protein